MNDIFEFFGFHIVSPFDVSSILGFPVLFKTLKSILNQQQGCVLKWNCIPNKT